MAMWMGVAHVLGSLALLGSCGEAAIGDGEGRADAGVRLDATVPLDAGSGEEDGAAPDPDAGPPDAAYVVDETCEGRYWRSFVGRNNDGHENLDRLAYESLAYVRGYVEDWNARGANVNLGAALALLVWETGARVAWVNDLCAENSYVRSPGCWENPQARYSYQLGMGGIHTSNFYPCRDVGWTSRMRARFHASADSHGFTVSPAQLDSVRDDLSAVCAGLEPEPIDYYLLAVHRDFEVPVDSRRNDLPRIGVYPFFTPQISIDLSFGELGADAPSLVDDAAMIERYGGADGRYGDPAYQERILESWNDWQAAECP